MKINPKTAHIKINCFRYQKLLNQIKQFESIKETILANNDIHKNKKVTRYFNKLDDLLNDRLNQLEKRKNQDE